MSIASLSPKSSTESLISVPDRFPPPVQGSMTWRGSELTAQEYVTSLSQADIDNIRTAIINFKLSRKPRGEISKATFPLCSDLAERLADMGRALYKGCGLAVLRGLERARLNDEEAVIAFAGISCYVAEKRATDSYANQTLSHIRDATHDKVPKGAEGIGLAGSKIPAKMDYHCDRFSGDILALHVRNDGGVGAGGEQYVASFQAIYNELLEKEPAVLETLASADWPWELKETGTALPYLEMGPALFFAQGRPILQLVKAPLLGSPLIPRATSMPQLSKSQMHALAVVEDLARQYGAKIDRKQGDIQYINNLGLMHARSAYVNSTGGKSSRHLLRMFLRDPVNMWKLPTAYLGRFNNPFIEGREQNLPIVDSDPWRKISGMESHG